MSSPAGNPLTLLDAALASLAMPVLEFSVTHGEPERARRRTRVRAGTSASASASDDQGWTRRYITRLDGHPVRLLTRRPIASESPLRDSGVWNPATRPVVVSSPPADPATSPVHGHAAGQPDFRSSYRDQMDVLLTIAGGTYAPRHRAALSAALVQLTTIAGRADLPITYVRAPSSAFSPDQLDTHETAGSTAGYPHLAWGAAVRITVGLDDSTEAARLRFLQSIAAFARAKDNGYGLHVSSPRLGHTRGDWTRLARLRDATVPSTIERTSESGLLVTLIGPERQGSYAAVAKLVTKNGLQVSACSAVTWNNVMFVQLSAVPPPGWQPWGPEKPILAEGPGRGCIIITSPHALMAEHPGGAPLYATWEVRQPPGVVGPGTDDEDNAATLMTKSRAVVEVMRLRLADKLGMREPIRPTFRVDLERHHPTGNGRVSGRIKAVVWPPTEVSGTDGLEKWLGALCGDIQRQARLAVLQLAPGTDVSVVTRLRVDWRQRWLGTWQEEAR